MFHGTSKQEPPVIHLMSKNKAIALLKCGIFISIPLITALITTIIIRSFNPVIVSGSSMKPTYKSGEIVFGNNKFSKEDLTRGTVIVFWDPEEEGKLLVKRIVGLPGESVLLSGGLIYINGKAISDPLPTIDASQTEPRRLGNEITLKEDEYIVLGDNRKNSADSRDFGAVKFEEIRYIIE